ncbi:hypothetical protein B0H14DRAFT_3698159 [Mycena olivaceomarginata]|nr:hypothetical protein B0H14DRAFT_3698159 [Mycena olivaceomarginata]
MGGLPANHLAASWMSEFIKRQAEGKLHMFWATMQEAWFRTYPEERILGLPLPTDADADARVLMPDELTRLGAAITARKGQLENWFRNHRKRLGNANGPAAGATMTLVQRILKLSVPTLDMLAEEGYNDTPDPTNPRTHPRPSKSAGNRERMRMRTRVVQALWAEAEEEERKAVEEEVEKEKKEMLEEELRREGEVKEAKASNPWEMQEGIDALETMLAEVHKAIFLATGWTPFTLVGGPNPRNGRLLAGNDFEECCVDFDANVLQPFQDFLRLCYSLADRQACALPHRAPVVSDEPPMQRVLPPEPPAPEPVKAKKSKKKKTQPKATGDELSAEVAKKSKPKNKTQPPKANEAPTVTASLTTGPDATVVASADKGGVPQNDDDSGFTATQFLATGPDATTVLAGADDGFPQIDNGSGLFSNLETRCGMGPCGLTVRQPALQRRQQHGEKLLDPSSTIWILICLVHDKPLPITHLPWVASVANVFGGDFASGSAGFDNDGFDDDEALFPKTITTPPRGVDDPPPRLYLPEPFGRGKCPAPSSPHFVLPHREHRRRHRPPMMTPAISPDRP